MTKIANSKPVLVIEYWNLGFLQYTIDSAVGWIKAPG